MKKPDNTVPVHDGSKFTWHGNVGYTEVSDLGRGYTGRVWKDAMDVGFIIRSHKTGVEKLFVYACAFSKSQDISDVDSFRYDAEDGTKVIVFND